MNYGGTETSLEQRRANVEAIAKRKREVEKCKRGHNNWGVRKNGRRYCKTCNIDRCWYYRQGLKYV